MRDVVIDMNIVYIRAAIEAATGEHLSLNQTKALLIEEGLISKREAKNLIFPGYKVFYTPSAPPKVEEPVLPVDAIVKDE